MLYPILKPKVKYRYIAVAIALIVMTACSDQKPPTYQGYVEGEFVYVSSSEAGRLDRLLVTRGQQATAKTPLFALESENEAAAQRQAQQQLSVAEAQLKDLLTGKRPLELDVIRAQLAQAIAEENKSVAKQVRDEAQYKAGAFPWLSWTRRMPRPNPILPGYVNLEGSSMLQIYLPETNRLRLNQPMRLQLAPPLSRPSGS